MPVQVRDPGPAFLNAARRRLRFVWIAATAQLIAPIVAGGLLLLLLVRWGWSLERALPIALVLLMIGFVSILIFAALMRITDWDAARAAERGLRVGDVLTTSLEFDQEANPLHRAIQQRALPVFESANARSAIPVEADRPRLLAGAVLGMAALIVFLVPPLGGRTAAGEAIETALELEAGELERIADAVDAAAVESGDELSTALRDLAAALRDSTSIDDALAEVDRAQRTLEAGLDSRSMSQKAAVQGLARDLSVRPLSAGAPLDAVSQLEGLADDLADLTPDEILSLTERLRDLASAQAAGNPGLASALSTAAAALASGDIPTAASALRTGAAEQLAGMAQARDRLALSETLAALAGSEGRLAAAGAAAAGGSAMEGAGGEGAGQGDGQGGGQGAGAGQGAGTGQGGMAFGGSPSGQISGVRPGNTGASGTGGIGSVGPGDGGSAETPVSTETVFAAADPGGASELVQVGIEGGTGQGAVTGSGDAPTQRGEALVPYTQVLPSYLEEAAAAMNRYELAPSLRAIVRSYFDRLADQAR